jgi:hypothetical protein
MEAAAAEAARNAAWPPARAVASLLQSAAQRLQKELDDLRNVARELEPGPQLQRVQALERSASRRLVQLSSASLIAVHTPASAVVRAPPPSWNGDTPRTQDGSTSTKSGRRRRGRQRERLPVERIWCTVLALNVLEELDSCWQVDEDDESMATIVDRGRAFLHAQARSDKRLRRLFKSGALFAAAERARKEWKAIQAHHVSLLRDADVINRFTVLTHIQRGSARVVRSMCTDHGTFATFLDTDGYIMRWQRFMVLTTLVLSTLLTSIWFYCAKPLPLPLPLPSGSVLSVSAG